MYGSENSLYIVNFLSNKCTNYCYESYHKLITLERNWLKKLESKKYCACKWLTSLSIKWLLSPGSFSLDMIGMTHREPGPFTLTQDNNWGLGQYLAKGPRSRTISWNEARRILEPSSWIKSSSRGLGLSPWEIKQSPWDESWIKTSKMLWSSAQNDRLWREQLACTSSQPWNGLVAQNTRSWWILGAHESPPCHCSSAQWLGQSHEPLTSETPQPWHGSLARTATRVVFIQNTSARTIQQHTCIPSMART